MWTTQSVQMKKCLERIANAPPRILIQNTEANMTSNGWTGNFSFFWLLWCKIFQAPFAARILPPPLHSSFSKLRSKRQELSWPIHTCPDLASVVSLACKVNESKSNEKDAEDLNKIIMAAQKFKNRAFIQHKLDINSLHIKDFCDAAIPNSWGQNLQLGYTVFLLEVPNRAEIQIKSSC